MKITQKIISVKACDIKNPCIVEYIHKRGDKYFFSYKSFESKEQADEWRNLAYRVTWKNPDVRYGGYYETMERIEKVGIANYYD